MKLSSLKIDPTRIEQGEWIGDLPEMEDLKVKVRGIGNADFRALQSKLIQTIPLKQRRRGLSPEDIDRIQARCLLETVLLDWSGMEGDDGKQVPYSRDLAETLLSDPEYRLFRDAVNYAASLVGAEQSDADEELEKKLLAVLDWRLKWGTKSNFLADVADEETDAAPFLVGIPDEPDLLPGAAFYLDAFSTLSSDRQVGALGGAGPIPWSSIDRYATRTETSGDDFDRLLHMIRALDASYLNEINDRLKGKRYGA